MEDHPPPPRQKAYSDGSINLPRNLASADVGLSLEEQMPPPSVATFYRIRSIPSSLELMALENSRSQDVTAPTVQWNQFIHYSVTTHRVALHFLFHLLLISLFETLFFWQFISRQEDNALTGLVNTYTSRAFSVCSNLTSQQRGDLRTYVSIFLDANSTLAAASASAEDRRTFNDILVRNSWLYFGGLATLFGLLTSTAHLRGLNVNWGKLVAENMGLVTLLGIYEWMFFRTVALRYQAVTPAELDGMIVSEFQVAC